MVFGGQQIRTSVGEILKYLYPNVALEREEDNTINDASLPNFSYAIADQLNNVIHQFVVEKSHAQKKFERMTREVDLEKFLNGDPDTEFDDLLLDVSKNALLFKELCWKYQPQPPDSILNIRELRNLEMGFEYIQSSHPDVKLGIL